MSDLSDFRRREHEPLARAHRALQATHRLAKQDLDNIEQLLDELDVPTHTADGDRLRTFGRVKRLAESRGRNPEAVSATTRAEAS